MFVYQDFEFIGFQKMDDSTFIPLFNNEQYSTITLPVGLINEKHIINFDIYNEKKSRLEQSGFSIILKEKMIEEFRLSSYIKYII